MVDSTVVRKTTPKSAITKCDVLTSSDCTNPDPQTLYDEDYDWDNALVASDSVSLPDKSDEEKSDHSTVQSLPPVHCQEKNQCDASTFGASSTVVSQGQSVYSCDSTKARVIPDQLLRIAEESDDEIVFERSLHSPRSYRMPRVLQSISPKWNRVHHRSPAKSATRFAFDDASLSEGNSRASHQRDDNTEVATEIAGNLTSWKYERGDSDESVFSAQALNSLMTPVEQATGQPMDFLDRTVAATMDENKESKVDKNQQLTVAAGSDDITEKLESFDHVESKSFPKWMVVAFTTFGLMALVVAVLLIIFAGPRMTKDIDGESSPPPLDGDRAMTMWDIASSVSGSKAMNDANSPAFRAFDWLSRTDNTPLTTPRQVLVERYIVTMLFFSTGGEGWNEQFNFLTEGSICGWNESSENETLPRGVVCDDKLKVKHIRLAQNRVGGTIPWEISLLKSLYTLDLSRNYIVGDIPVKLGQLQALREINFTSNMITGLIPNTLGSLTKLVSLDLSSNLLTGIVPLELGLLVGLEQLSLGDNQLQGQLPDTLEGLTNLTSLNIFRNQLTGTIPESLGSLPNLTFLNFASNDFLGDISEDFCFSGHEYNSFWADCRGDSPKVKCSCCTICCQGDGKVLEC